MKRIPNIRLNQINQLVLSKTLASELRLLPDRVTPFYIEPIDDGVKVHILPNEWFTGCWFSADTNPKSGHIQYKASRGNMLTGMLLTHGFERCTNYKVIDIVANDSFTITKKTFDNSLHSYQFDAFFDEVSEEELKSSISCIKKFFKNTGATVTEIKSAISTENKQMVKFILMANEDSFYFIKDLFYVCKALRKLSYWQD